MSDAVHTCSSFIVTDVSSFLVRFEVLVPVTVFRLLSCGM